MWVPQSPTLHMMSCTDHAFLWCPSCFSPSAHTEPHSTKLPSVHHLHHTVFSQKFTFQVRTFWQFWHTTLRMHCISHSSALFPALWSSAKKMCSGHWAHLSTVSCLPAACPGWSCKNCPDRPQCPSPLVDSTLQHKAVACSAHPVKLSVVPVSKDCSRAV